MPGENCSIYGCTVSRRSKYKGVSILNISSGDNTFDKEWREKLLAVITRDRESDAALRESIKAKKLFICKRHFNDDQLYRHASRATLVPGSIPSLNFPLKSFPPPPRKTRESAIIIQQKKSLLATEIPIYHPVVFYKSFEEMLCRSKPLKLIGWNLAEVNNNVVYFNFNGNIHVVPKYEIYVNEHFSFTIRFFF